MLTPLDAISPDTSTQARHDTDPGVIDEYATAMRDGTTFPPVVLFRDAAGTLRVGDGFHRVAAARRAGLDVIEAEVRDGGAREAIEHSIRSNARHGLRFSNADKRRVVGLMLDDPEWAQLSDREIARRCGVSQPFVGKVRAERGDNGYQPSSLSPEERMRMADAEAMIQACIDSARRGVAAFLDTKARLTADQYEAWLDHHFGGGWMDVLDDLGMVLGSPEDQAKIRQVYPGPVIGDLPVGSLDPLLAYTSAEGRHGLTARVFPSTVPGHWFVSVHDLASSEVIGLGRPVREDAVPVALHQSGYVCGDDPRWTAGPCDPARKNPDLEPVAV